VLGVTLIDTTFQVVLNASDCKIKLVRTFSINPAEFTRVALEFLAKVKSPAPLSGICEYSLAAL
jgi:hypothetical protein